jgi:hypothetical protein
VIREETEDLCEVRINFARELHFGENIGKLRFARNPVELMDTVLLTLADKVEALFDVATSLAREFANLDNLDGGFIVDHEDGRGEWKTSRRFTPLFGAKVEHIIEKHLDVGSSHCGGTCGHIFGFRRRHSNGDRHGRMCFDESAVVENHEADGDAASVRTILPTGVGENGEIGIWDAMVKADVVDGVGGTIGIEFKSVVGAAAKVAKEPRESSEVNCPRGDACFCKFADSKKDIGLCVEGEVKKSTHGRAEGEASLFLFNKSNIRSGDRVIVLAEGVVRRKGSIALREFGIWVVTLKGVQNVAVLIQGVGGYPFGETIGQVQGI